MSGVQTLTLLVATLTTGLMAGLFTAFAYSVMPGLHRSSDRTFVEAMRNINVVIVNPLFMLLFMGSIPLLILATVLAWRGTGRTVLIWILAATILYLIAFFVTGGVNVPLNDKLAAAGNPDTLASPAAARTTFETPWVTWNIVRAVLHTAAFACLLWALLGYGAERTAAQGRIQHQVPTPSFGPAHHTPHTVTTNLYPY